MKKKYLLLFFLIFSNLYAVDFPISTEKRDCNNCRSFEENSGVNDKSAVYIFMSFSVPENTWLELNKTRSDVRDRK